MPPVNVEDKKAYEQVILNRQRGILPALAQVFLASVYSMPHLL